ncbi:hypothetical protein F6Y05_34870 [Bacillus megaterium]|nr:hypothetical protein [Priestia megaterium]
MSSALVKKVKQYASDIVINNLDEDSFLDYAQKLESLRKRIKDYDNAMHTFLQEEVDLYKQKEQNGQSIDKFNIETIEMAKKLLENAKQIRRNNTKKTSKVDTNILTAPTFFVGKKKELLNYAKEGKPLTFVQDGVKSVTYENVKGYLLTYNDARTLFALLDLLSEQGNGNKLSFTKYQLLNKMNLVDGGRQYQIVSESLEKLRNTFILLHQAYDIKERQRFRSSRFPLISSEHFQVDTKNEKVISTTHEIEFSDYVCESIQNGNYSLISLALWDEIETDSGKGVYSMITGISNMENNEEYVKEGIFEIPINIVYKHLKLENPKPAKNKDIVEKGCNELQDIEVIEEFYFKKAGNRVTSIVIKPSQWLNELLSKKKHLPSVEQLDLPLELNSSADADKNLPEIKQIKLETLLDEETDK